MDTVKETTKVLCTCVKCSKEFLVHACYIRRDGKRLYCSMACRNLCYKKEGNPTYKANEGWTKCKNCGSDFKVKPCSLRLDKSKTYCSKQCRDEKIGSVEKKCIECGKRFTVFNCKQDLAKCCSKRCSGINRYRINGQQNTGVMRGRGGKREDLNNQYFRSSWEANYARYLNFLVKNKQIDSWQYEPDTFEFFKIKRGTRFYTPDFKVFDKDGSYVYHEVKGHLDDKSKTRTNRMAKYYPNEKIILIQKEWFRKNGKTLSNIIPTWESGVY